MQPPIPGLETYLQSGTGNYDRQIRELLSAGVPPNVIRALGSEKVAKTLKGAGDAQTFLSGFAKDLPVGRVGFAGGMIAPALTAVEEAQAGRPTGALGSLFGGGAATLAGVGLGKLAFGGLAAAPGLPGLIGKLGQVALPLFSGAIGSSSGAQLAESAKRSLTGDPTTGKDDLKNQLAKRGLISKQDLDIYDRTQGIQTSNILNLNQGIADQEYLNMQRMNPLLQKMENAKLVRAQALMASQGQQYAMLGTLATAGKLATGSQAEMGKTVRTVLGSNPYASANLQAPSVSFG
jgi:hypothetical protein